MKVLSQVAPSAVVIGSELEDVFAFEIIRTIRADPELSAARVLLLSERALTPRWVRDPANQYDADLCLDLSAKPEEITNAIAALLAGKPEGDRTSRGEPRRLAAHSGISS